MKKKYTSIIFLLLLLFGWSAQAQDEANTELFQQIMAADSLLFEQGFNNCNLEAIQQVTHPDFEFYHDQSGTTYGKENFISGIEKNICSLDYRPLRKVIPESVEVFPLKSNGEIYGAIQKGKHEFYAVEEGKAAYITSLAKFTHLWMKEDDQWLLKRVLSFDHKSPEELKTEPDFNNVQSVENWLKKQKVPALGLAIIRNQQLQSVAVFGELTEGKSAPVDAIFNVASLTKPIVTMLTLQLVDQGKWQLDEPLFHYWTDPDVKGEPRAKKLTTRHILSHQSGFKNWRFQNEDGKLAFDYEPGKGYGYSGEGFEYLKEALQVKFKQPLEQLAEEVIFQPLKMTDTQFFWNNSTPVNRFAKWHDTEGKNAYETYKNTQASAADDLLTSVEDYGRFAAHILQGGGLSSELFQEMITQQNGKENSVKMGLGWEILPKLKGEEYALLHTGGDQGVNTLVMLLPETGEGLVIFTNGDNGKNLYFPLIEKYLSLGKVITGK